MRRYRRWSDMRLLAATRAGDADAFGAFFERHSVAVMRFVRRRTTSADDAADLTAETFAAALLSVHRGHAQDVTQGAAWLTGIARKKLIDSYRAGQLRDIATRELGLSRAPLTTQDIAYVDAAADVGLNLSAAIASLSSDERRAVLERIVLERDYERMAEGAQQSEPVIRKRVSRGLARLRNTMGAET
jgi:RNA polymerase sigma factor (sigma-70 family)